MRKLTVILLFATLCITKMQADTFLVYAFSGDVCSTKGKIHTTDKFSSKEVLTLIIAKTNRAHFQNETSRKCKKYLLFLRGLFAALKAY